MNIVKLHDRDNLQKAPPLSDITVRYHGLWGRRPLPERYASWDR